MGVRTVQNRQRVRYLFNGVVMENEDEGEFVGCILFRLNGSADYKTVGYVCVCIYVCVLAYL